MKKSILLVFAVLCSIMTFAQGAEDWRIHPNDAKYYIRGVFDVTTERKTVYTLTNVTTQGVTLNYPQNIYYGEYQDDYGDVMFTFNDIETDCPTKYDYISYWVYDDETQEWQSDAEIRNAQLGMESRKIMTVMLVLDCSSSLENEFVQDLEKVKEGAITFLQTMYNASHSGNIRIGIIGFNSLKQTKAQIRQIEPLTEGSYGEMCNFIRRFKEANGTALYYSLDTAIDMIKKSVKGVDPDKYVKPIIVTFTDGVDQTSFDNKKGIKNADTYYSVVNKHIQNADIEHFVIPFLGADIKTDAQKEKFERVLRSLTKPNDNSHYLPVKSMGQLGYIFGQLANNLIERWQILRCYVAPARQGRVCWTFGKKAIPKPAPQPIVVKSERPLLLGLNMGIGVPIEFGRKYNGDDYKGAGLDFQLGFDFAYPISDRFAMGFFTSIGGGFTGGSFSYYESSRYHNGWYYGNYFGGLFRFSTGLLMEMGELDKRPFLLGISPCLGFGFTRASNFLPLEIRFGRIFSNNWYVTGDLLFGIPLGGAMYLEPTIRFGYNFGHNVHARKK